MLSSGERRGESFTVPEGQSYRLMWVSHLGSNIWEGFLFLSFKKVPESLRPQEFHPEDPCWEKRHIHPLAARKHCIYLMQAGTRVQLPSFPFRTHPRPHRLSG